MYLIFQYSYERDFMIIYPGFLVIMFLKEEGYILEGELILRTTFIRICTGVLSQKIFNNALKMGDITHAN